ncbi:TIGR03016 family PEP-CTERM system-associated outer membrane protein [Neptunicella sp.]|uniref:TIGR03016 family PEP-CTERM system-associated outer membrane protein n=1 Tax=Neptunicella sp. TaxID=2125986 RepID=UPI003F690DCD
MATTTQEMNKVLVGKVLKIKRLSLLVGLSLATIPAQADWQFTPSFDSTIDAYDRQFDDGTAAKDEVLSLMPKFTAVFDGNKADGSFYIQHTRVLPNSDEFTKARSYTSYGLATQSRFGADLFSLRLSANQDYQVRDPADAISSNTLSTPEQFSKVKRYSGGLTFSLPNPLWFGLTAGIQTAKSESESIEGQGFLGLNNENEGANIRFYQGKNVRFINWNLTATYNNTKREVSDDFKSTMLNAKVSLPLFISNLRFVVTAQDEKNELGSNVVEFSDAYDQTSYGAGLEWFVADNRYITITYNRIEKSLNDQQQNYLGLDAKWALSSRTSIDANYGKRFYGDSYAFNLIHSTRDIRTSIGYEESITSFSRINQNTVNAVIVCSVGETQLENCFQPEVGYELLPGEQGFNISQQIPELSEEVYLRKSANIDVSWTRRKLTLAVGARKGSTDYLESNRQRDDQSLSLRASYKLNYSTNLNFSGNFAEYQYETEMTPDKTKTIGVGLSKKLGRNITSSINLRYLDRKSDLPSNSLTDRRITASLGYTF